MPPKCRVPESYILSSTIRNTTLEGDDQHREHQKNEDQDLNDDMDKDNISDTNQEDEIHRLIQDTFAPRHYQGLLVSKSKAISQHLLASMQTSVC